VALTAAARRDWSTLGCVVHAPHGYTAFASRRCWRSDRIEYEVSCIRAKDGKRALVPLLGVCGPGDDAESVITIMCTGEN